MSGFFGKIGKGLAPALLLPVGVALAAPTHAQDLAVRGETVYTMAGDPIDNGVVVIRDGKIAAVGAASDVSIPDGFAVREAAVVVPGIIDARAVVGLAGQMNIPHDQDQLEHSEPMQPELRAIDAYNARERLISWLRGFGITTVHTGHAPGEVISGETLIAKTRGETVEEAVFVPRAMLAATLGDGAVKQDHGKVPGTRSKAAAILRQKLVDAGEYAAKMGTDKAKGRDLGLEAMVRVLNGEVPLMITVDRAGDIMTALRLQEEFGFRLVLDSGAEAYTLTDEIAAAGVPVLVHPTMMRAAGETENATMENASLLRAAGIPVALTGGYESYVPKARVILFEAGVAAAHGLGFDGALAAVTRDAAEILGIADRVGTLERGKDGDLALFDGDPFEYTTHCTGTVIEGVVVSEGEWYEDLD